MSIRCQTAVTAICTSNWCIDVQIVWHILWHFWAKHTLHSVWKSISEQSKTFQGGLAFTSCFSNGFDFLSETLRCKKHFTLICKCWFMLIPLCHIHALKILHVLYFYNLYTCIRWMFVCSNKRRAYPDLPPNSPEVTSNCFCRVASLKLTLSTWNCWDSMIILPSLRFRPPGRCYVNSHLPCAHAKQHVFFPQRSGWRSQRL